MKREEEGIDRAEPLGIGRDAPLQAPPRARQALATGTDFLIILTFVLVRLTSAAINHFGGSQSGGPPVAIVLPTTSS